MINPFSRDPAPRGPAFRGPGSRNPSSRLRAAWGAVLSLVVPGLGQVYAGAWRLGLIVLAVNEALSFGARVLTVVAPPTLPALAGVGGIVVVSLVLMLVAAFDAARRIRGAPVAARPRWFRSTWFVAIVLIILGFGADMALPFGWRGFSIPSGSMVPTLMVGDYLVADTRAGIKPARGDVVVFTRAAEGSEAVTTYVKRVIGLPGDHVSIRDGRVVLNNEALSRRDDGDTFIPEEMSFGKKGHRWTETLPGGRAYPIVTMMPGGAMPETTVPPGQMFVMGDNRDNSLDSRFARFGTVPIDHIVGRAQTLYWSREQSRVLTDVR